MVGGRRVEVPENAARGGAGIDVAAVLRQVPLQPFERGELALDAAVARCEHAERVVEARRRGFGEEVGGHGAVPSATAEDMPRL